MRNRALRRFGVRARLAAQDIIFRGIATLALIVIAISFSARGRQDCREPQSANNTQAKQENCEEWFVRFFIRTVDDPVTFFTLVLAISTVGLWIVTWSSENRQGRHTLAALKVARRAAEAAQKSAEVAERTLEQTSAPYLDISIAPKAAIHKLIGGGVVADFVSGIFAEYRINNYGASPAIVLEIYQGIVRSRGIPAAIGFPPPQSNLNKIIVIGNSRESDPIPVQFPLGGIMNLGDEAIWVIIQIRYRDVFGSQYITATCRAYNSVRATFSAHGGEKYNCNRKLTDGERQIAEERDGK